MAIATYTTDLTTINVVDTAGGTTNWTAIGGGASGLVSETDFYIQGNACISKAGWSAAIRGMIFTTTAITVPTNSAIFMWLYMWAPTALAVESAGGLQVIIGSSNAAYKHWYVRGSDTYQYGGWICVPIDPTFTQNTTTGAPTATLSSFGALANITGAVSKGQPLGIDAFRYGRSLITVGGQTGSYGNFASASTTDAGTAGANRWGILQSIDGGYLHQGLFLMGTASTLVDFRDSNKSINIANTKKVSTTFNGFEVRNTSSNIEWTNINITALGTQSKGYFEDVNDATITFSGCVFTDMSTFIFKSKNTINSCTFRRVGVITQNNALINDCLFDSSQYLLSSNPSRVTNNNFVSGATGHGIWITTPGTYSFTGNSFTGYAVTNGSTGNEALYNNSGGLVTLNLSGGTVPTYRNGTGATTSIIASVSITLTGLKDNTEIRVYTTATINELAGIETATDGTTDNRSFTFALTAGVIIDIAIINVTYENERITAYTVPATNASIPVQQRFDRNYNNP